MNKKLLALLLASTFVFAGCNQNKTENKEETKQEEKADTPTEEGKEEAKNENNKESEAEIVLPNNKVTLKAASYKF